ncbi:UPF0728 protein C10orf53 homolog [Onychostruthus taczanowskii]|uniref:UPF0728 protein C10orf53 homolog n=1 Tax=Onychostruthus taczanowskii TaxID=356909 RepID=UPI001B805054|nr:UPF0728 protein C10orf53 homolog [Onychostruthus taczanowskii]
MATQQQKLKACYFMKDSFLSHFYFFTGLKADGHHLIPEVVTNWDAVDLVVNREMAFHCNIYELDFGGDGKLDPLCEEARKAVLNA